MKKKLFALLSALGPGIFAIGYTIGTGSVTSMAAPTFVTRPLIVREKGWGPGDLKTERRDSVVSATLMFVISGAIMAVAMGALFAQGRGIEKILDEANFKSLYYYYGIVTMGRFYRGDIYFRVPNESVRQFLLKEIQSSKIRANP